MPNPSKRMTANPARPVARYRPGKPIAEQDSSDEEEEESEEEQKQQPRKPQPRPQRPAPAPQAEESEDEDEDGFLTDPEEEDGADQSVKATEGTDKPRPDSSQQTHLRPLDRPPERGTRTDEHGGSDSSEEDGEDESEEEESSEEEAPRRKFQRPTFIKKSDRKQSHSQSITPSLGEPDYTTTIQISGSTPQPSTSELDEQTRRLAQADLLIKDKLERDIIARAQGKKAWDDDEDLLPENQVDDTDGLDPEAEYAAWKLRELQRLKRDREALIAREKEIEEVDRRRNLTAEERDREDREFLDRQKQEREQGRSDTQYLARYHHKGAFFQGDETAEFLKKRDVMGARFEDQVSDKSVLPEYMRLRDMTKLGKKGRTRYTDLKGQDTGKFGEDVKWWRGSGRGDRFGDGGDGADFDTRGLDDRFRPDDQRGGGGGGRGGGTGPTGANASVVKPRRDHDTRSRDRTSDRAEKPESRHDSRDRDGGRDRDTDGNSHRREPRRSYSQSRPSRSRSPHDPSNSNSNSNSRRKHSRSRSPVARKKRHVDDFRSRDRDDRDRDSQRRDGDTVGYRDRSHDRDRERDRRRG